MSSEARPVHVLLDRDYDGSSSTLRAARSDVVECLKSRSVDQDLQKRAELVVSELASNAIQASPTSDYSVRVSLADDGAVLIVVTSWSRDQAPPPREAWGPAHARAPRGRGLLIVGELTDHVEVGRPAAHTVVVTATIRATSAV
jgi:anti-sigma regulatory factor (Ser/Thr protein kinase)